MLLACMLLQLTCIPLLVGVFFPNEDHFSSSRYFLITCSFCVGLRLHVLFPVHFGMSIGVVVVWLFQLVIFISLWTLRTFGVDV